MEAREFYIWNGYSATSYVILNASTPPSFTALFVHVDVILEKVYWEAKEKILWNFL